MKNVKVAYSVCNVSNSTGGGMRRSGCWLDVSRQVVPVNKTSATGRKTVWNDRSESGGRFVEILQGLFRRIGYTCSSFQPRMLLRNFLNFYDLLLYVMVGMVAMLCYLNSLNGDLIHDDIVAITTNPDVLGHTSLRELFLNDFWGKPMADPLSHKSYRPLTVLTFRWNMMLGGQAVEGFHLVNVVLHGLVVCLLTFMCRTVLQWNTENSAITGLLFAAHPVHTEAVSSIVGRAELLSALFFFVSFLCFHKYSKETKSFVKTWFGTHTLSLLPGFLVLLGFRIWMLHGSLPKFSVQDNPAAFAPSVITRFLTKTYLVTFNAYLMLCPTNLSYDWQMGSIPLVETVLDMRNFGSMFLFGGVLTIFIYYRRIVKIREITVLSVALAILIFPFLPASNLFITVGFVVAERILYIPSAGLYILVTHGLQRLKDWSPRATWLLRISTFFLLTVFMWCTLRRNAVWQSRETLFRSGLESVPQNAKVHYNYANLEKDLGNIELSKRHYRTALSLWPSHASAHNNLGTLLTDPIEAEYHFKAAISINPFHARAYFNLANLHSKQDKKEEAEAYLKQAIDIDPGFAEAYSALASLYADLGHMIDAEKLHLVALSISPHNVDALNNYGVFIQSLGREDEAVEFYQRAVQINPNHTVALLNAARTLRSLKYIDEAKQLYKRALEIDEDPQVMDNLGTLYLKSGRFREAHKLYGQLINKHESYLEGKVHYAQLLMQERSFYQAEELLLSVLNNNATYREAFHQLAVLFIHTNKTSEGLENILQALRLCHVTDKSCAQLYVSHGDLMKDMGDLETAAQSYSLAIQLDPEICHAHLNLGVTYHLQGWYLEALKHYQTAQTLDPQNPVVLENLEKLKKKMWKKSALECNEESKFCRTW
ncbi:transmembrane and TPR repeat-containing protein 1-like [Limulus polyphemus]|uniref:dolichyl-phosphate-mannose--protein mannosyltransferase n=1 Tax=Limulus polyphemus TaxID=6850 RepID=A0ABM1SHV4_LIMPO|nr:transmembrane and TPR repeat-containing protein 1-like [Limulus polyphemus]